jgi:hypothetical protein
MTTVDVAELRRLAGEATPGPWTADLDVYEGADGPESAGYFTAGVCNNAKGSEPYLLFLSETTILNDGTNVTYEQAKATREYTDAAYIAAVSPDVILALLDRIEELERLASR